MLFYFFYDDCRMAYNHTWYLLLYIKIGSTTDIWIFNWFQKTISVNSNFLNHDVWLIQTIYYITLPVCLNWWYEEWGSIWDVILYLSALFTCCEVIMKTSNELAVILIAIFYTWQISMEIYVYRLSLLRAHLWAKQISPCTSIFRI